MAEYKREKLYWIRITDHFFTSDTVDYLMSQKNGSDYIVIYQMICLKTVNQNGLLARKIGDTLVPFDVDKLTRDLKWFNRDTILVALELFKALQLIYVEDNGILHISHFEKLIAGSQTEGAYKKSIQRMKKEYEEQEPELPLIQYQKQALLEENVKNATQVGGVDKGVDNLSTRDKEMINKIKDNNNTCACTHVSEREIIAIEGYLDLLQDRDFITEEEVDDYRDYFRILATKYPGMGKIVYRKIIMYVLDRMGTTENIIDKDAYFTKSIETQLNEYYKGKDSVDPELWEMLNWGKENN